MYRPVPQSLDFPATEKAVLAYWREARIFEKSLAMRRGGPEFVFFEGPPTANGTPHNGHVLTRVIKDVFPRYQTMRGRHVARKAGWDTHGLPVEVEVEKELGIHGREEIEAYGVEAFTRRCIESVFRYTDVWRELTERIGFWVDLDEAYVTFHRSYVESVWWALSTLHERGLLYQGHKVLWWWPQGGTALSSGEVGLGYKTVDDPSVTVRFPLHGGDGAALLAWTTTPWTLPSNCALTVHPELDYAFVRLAEETIIVAEALVGAVVGDAEHAIESTVKGADLIGRTYEPPFRYADPVGGRAWEIIGADFVTTSAGTGVVHTAPAFGEDDHRAAAANGIGMLQLVRPDGTFAPEVTDFAGRFCKEADRDIIRDLRGRGLVFDEGTVRHDYPFCWRSDDDPLIQYARPAWFIRTTEVIDRCRANNQAVHWMPDHIKDGRFGDFLANNVDWALSRERFWGTPLNLWICEGCGAREAPTSLAALRDRNPGGVAAVEARLADSDAAEHAEHLIVHKPWIDQITLPCEACGETMARVPEVIDCWFDSGCMPFAQWGWPHQNDDRFKASWPADFISEAIDQTRGWFYSLMMISTLLFDEAAAPHPFRNCIVLGHVTDKKGRKESKSKGNYTPPDHILETSGADAMRWYFYSANPPYNNTRYSPEAVRQGAQEFLVKLHHVYAFFVIYANIDGFDAQATPRRPVAERALLDRWILSELHLATADITARMDAYQVYEASQRLIALTDALSNWYVRRSRARFWAAGDRADKWDAFHTLHEVLCAMARLAAPFVPFLSEDMWRNLSGVERRADDAIPESVHLCDWPSPDEALVDEALSEDMRRVREIVRTGLASRALHKLRTRQPLACATVIPADFDTAERVAPYEGLICEELNVKALRFVADGEGTVSWTVKPNYRALGPLFGKRMPVLRAALDAADPEAVRGALARDGAYQLRIDDGEVFALTPDQVAVTVEATEGFAASSGAAGVVVLDTRLDDALRTEGMAREITSRVQGLRKEQALDFVARIRLQIAGDDAVTAAARAHADTVAAETLADQLDVVAAVGDGGAHLEGAIDGARFHLRLEVAEPESPA